MTYHLIRAFPSWSDTCSKAQLLCGWLLEEQIIISRSCLKDVRYFRYFHKKRLSGVFVCVEFVLDVVTICPRLLCQVRCISSIVLYLFYSKGVSSLQARLPYCHTYCLWKGGQREGNSVLIHLNAFTLKFRIRAPSIFRGDWFDQGNAGDPTWPQSRTRISRCFEREVRRRRILFYCRSWLGLSFAHAHCPLIQTDFTQIGNIKT